MDRAEAGAMPGRHILVKALHGIGTGEITELLVHVVRSRTRVVSQPDAEVLDLQRLLFMDLSGEERPTRTTKRSASQEP